MKLQELSLRMIVQRLSLAIINSINLYSQVDMDIALVYDHIWNWFIVPPTPPHPALNYNLQPSFDHSKLGMIECLAKHTHVYDYMIYRVLG